MSRAPQFGLNVNPNAGGLAIAERFTAIADANGLELVGVQDHPYNPQLYDTFSLITWLAAKSTRVRFFPNVANLPMRPPAMLAKQAATIDALSGGRFELGLGAGGFPEAVAGMGGPRRETPQARAALSEAIDILRGSWGNEPFSFKGKHYLVPGVQPGPRPAHDIGIWLGVTEPRSAALVGAKPTAGRRRCLMCHRRIWPRRTRPSPPRRSPRAAIHQRSSGSTTSRVSSTPPIAGSTF